MSANKNCALSEDKEQIEYEIFCDGFEQQYTQAKEDGVFDILKILELDRQHSDINIVEAVDYFNKKDGVVEQDAPMEFLTKQEKSSVIRDKKFRPALYCMLLSQAFSAAIENKTIFMKHSRKYSFES